MLAEKLEQYETNLNILLFNSNNNKSDVYQEKLTKTPFNSEDEIPLARIFRMA